MFHNPVGAFRRKADYSDGDYALIIGLEVDNTDELIESLDLNPTISRIPRDRSLGSIDAEFEFPNKIDKVTGLESDEYTLDNKKIHLTVEMGITEKRWVTVYSKVSLEDFGIEDYFGEYNYEDYIPSQEGMFEGLIDPIKSYDNRFLDIPVNCWYYDSAVRVYNTGLITGMTETSFAPNEVLSIEQVITLAARVRSRYDDDGEPFEKKNASDPWYQPYVDYAEEKGIIGENTVQSNIGKAARRCEMSYVIAHTLPSSMYAGSEIQCYFGDVYTKATNYANEIHILYNTGIVLGTGTNERGEVTFDPEELLTRAQAVVFIDRLITPGIRIP